MCVCVCVCVGVYNLSARSPAPLLPPDWVTIVSAQITREPSVLLASLLLLTEGARRMLLEHVRPRHSFSLQEKPLHRLPWLRICLPMQGTQVQSLVLKDFTCLGATKPIHHDY